MPARQRSSETLYEAMDDSEYEYDVEPQRNNQNVREEPEEEDVAQEEQESDDDDDGSPFSSCSDKDEFVLVKLAEVRKEVQCPICLGIIRKTRTVMECLHRFCRECIDKSMRLGNNECPACRAHCASRRSLRDDPNYDALIAVLYPNIDKYEEEELAFREEEKARNKQIQASLAQTSRRQLEALGKKRTTGKATQILRGRRTHKSSEPQGSDDGDNDGSKDSSSADEPKRCKRSRGARSSLPSSSADGGCDDNEAEATREILAWGRGGIRSHTRHGGISGSASKKARNIRISKLIHHLRMNAQNDDEMDIHLKLVSLDEQNIPNSQYLYLCCTPTTSIKHIREYVALENGFQEDEIELLMVKGDHSELKPSDSTNVSEQPEPVVINPLTDELQLLEEHLTLLNLANNASPDNLTVAYRKKSASW